MDDLRPLREFRAESARDDPQARAAAWRALEGRFDQAEASVQAPSTAAPQRRLLFRGRRLVATATALALAAALTGVLVLSSGPTAQSAAAEVLRRTAAVAAAADRPSALPGRGQFLYLRTKSLELQGWIPGDYSVGGDTLSQRNAFSALVPSAAEEWRSADGATRQRTVLGTPRFFSPAEKSRWKEAGSPLPGPFDPSSQTRGSGFGDRVVELRRGVIDVEYDEGQGLDDLSKLPTEPTALRLAIERRQHADSQGDRDAASKPLDNGRVIAELWDLLNKPRSTPALRAAVFGALAEEPGIELKRRARDLIGRPGYALSYEKPTPKSSLYQQAGVRVEYIFDPETSSVLGRREVVVDPAKGLGFEGVSAGTVRREVAYLQSALVGSRRERPDADGGES